VAPGRVTQSGRRRHLLKAEAWHLIGIPTIEPPVSLRSVQRRDFAKTAVFGLPASSFPAALLASETSRAASEMEQSRYRGSRQSMPGHLQERRCVAFCVLVSWAHARWRIRRSGHWLGRILPHMRSVRPFERRLLLLLVPVAGRTEQHNTACRHYARMKEDNR